MAEMNQLLGGRPMIISTFHLFENVLIFKKSFSGYLCPYLLGAAPTACGSSWARDGICATAT